MDRTAYAGMNALEGQHWWFVARRTIIATLVRTIIAPARNARILEAGCGTGGNLALFSQFGQLTAFEYDQEARAIASQRRICPVHAGALPDKLHAVAGPYDLVALLDVLEHIDDDVASLRALGGLLGHDGRLLITVPAVPMLWSNHDVIHHHKRRYTVASLRAAISAAGLEVERLGYFNSLLFPLALIQRGFARLLGRTVPADDLPGPALNRMLTAIFSSERHLIHRLRFPIGLSLFAVVRR